MTPEAVEAAARELARENEIAPWFMLPNYIKAGYRDKARSQYSKVSKP